MYQFIDNLGGRKFVFALVLFISLVVMLALDVSVEKIATFFTYATVIFGLYVGGNVVQKFSDKE